MNASGLKTPRGDDWYASTVRASLRLCISADLIDRLIRSAIAAFEEKFCGSLTDAVSHASRSNAPAFNAHRPATPDKAASFKSLYPNRPRAQQCLQADLAEGGPDTALGLVRTDLATPWSNRRLWSTKPGCARS